MTDVAIAERTENAIEQAGAKNNLATHVRLFEKELDQRLATFAQALPEHVPVAKFKRNLITAVVQNPDLLRCFRPSLFQAAMTSASLGLLLDPNLGHGYILPFKDNKKGVLLAQFIPGYRGYIYLARQSGEISSISAYEVCENDYFDYALGLTEKLDHKPSDGDRGAITHFYCIVRYKDGGHHIEVMTKGEVDRIRLRSQSKNSPAWRDDYAMMGRKTVIRRAAKYMPLSVQRAAALDAAYDTGRIARFEDGEIVIDGDAVPVDEAEGTGEQPDRPMPGSRLDQFERQQQQARTEPKAETAHDPQTGEVRDDAGQGERDPFFAGESYEIVVPAKGRHTYDWDKWAAFMMETADKAITEDEVLQLRDHNEHSLKRAKVSSPEKAVEVETYLQQRAQQLGAG